MLEIHFYVIDIVRVMAHNCNLIGHTSNSWMSWSKDVGSVAGLYRITPPDGVDTITRTFDLEHL